ncbi:hypothetical protein N7451_002777 [Penicillium sp. IBT 35674x]|nr:hypothetical protein N7451_002777 [Penicillium sp. IBT 35674x]
MYIFGTLKELVDSSRNIRPSLAPSIYTIAKRDPSEDRAIRACNSRNIPTMLAGEGEGAWVLDRLEGEAWDRHNELLVTTDLDVHGENLIMFGANWYENARDHPVAAELLAEE